MTCGDVSNTAKNIITDAYSLVPCSIMAYGNVHSIVAFSESRDG
jgi:hypothetical protein